MRHIVTFVIVLVVSSVLLAQGAPPAAGQQGPVPAGQALPESTDGFAERNGSDTTGNTIVETSGVAQAEPLDPQLVNELQSFRRELATFVSDLDRVADQAVGVRDGAYGTSGASVSEVIRAVDRLSLAELWLIRETWQPLILTWQAIDALPAEQLAPMPRFGPAAYTLDEQAELESLRDDLDHYFEVQAQWAPALEEDYPSYESQMANYRELVQGISLDELRVVRDGLDLVPGWRELVQNPGVPPTGGLRPPTSGSELWIPDDPTLMATLEQGHPECGSMWFGPIAAVVLDNLANAAMGFADIFGSDFFVSAFAAGSNFPNIAKIVAVSIWTALAIPGTIGLGQADVYMNCNEFVHQNIFQSHTQDAIDESVLISGLIEDHDEYFTGRANRIDKFNEEFKKLTLRLEIEKDLLRKGNERVALFQIPAAVCVNHGEHTQCGLLETVADIVAETIALHRAAGREVTLAQAAWDDAELQRASGKYKEAYTRYRLAYVRAVLGH